MYSRSSIHPIYIGEGSNFLDMSEGTGNKKYKISKNILILEHSRAEGKVKTYLLRQMILYSSWDCLVDFSVIYIEIVCVQAIY